MKRRILRYGPPGGISFRTVRVLDVIFHNMLYRRKGTAPGVIGYSQLEMQTIGMIAMHGTFENISQ
jgi:hypothetical protein